MKMYFIYNREYDKLFDIGTKKFSGYKSYKTAKSYLTQNQIHWNRRYIEGFEIVEVELK